MENQTELQLVKSSVETPALAGVNEFELAQRKAKMISSSSLVPKEYQGQANMPNVMIALEMANRMGASPLMVMQNLYIVHGKPSWSSQFIISAINACGRFSPLRFEVTGAGNDLSCYAWAYEKGTQDKLTGPSVTMKMAADEGWISKAGSKWKTMPELMIRYRSAAFFGRLYAPDILMGMQTMEEVQDVEEVVDNTPRVDAERINRVTAFLAKFTTAEDLEANKAKIPADLMEFYNNALSKLTAK